MPRFAEAEALGYEFANSPREDPREDPRERRRIGDVHVLTLKERAQMLLDGPAGVAAESLNVALSLVLVVIAVVDSYDEADEDALSFSRFEICCMLFFLVDYGVHLFASADRLRFVVSPIGLIDAVTILPTLLAVFLVSLSVSALSMLRVACIFRLLAILRLYRIVQAYRGYDYQLAVLAFMIAALVMVAAGVFQVLEQPYYTEQGLARLQFHQAVYFVLVTLATVGYGDIAPHTAAGQAFVILLIVAIVTAVPRQINRLVELSRLQHGYMHSYSLRKRSVHYGGHVVVTGHLTPAAVSAFLHEFYRPRQGRVNMNVVLLADAAPSDRLQALLLHVRFRRRVTFLKGSLLRDKDARRVHVDKAAAVFVLADKKARARRAEAADARAVLQALAVDKFRFSSQLREASSSSSSSSSRPTRLRCFLEVLSPRRTRGLRAITGVEVALNTPRLRTAILARNVVCPGATALLLNLLYSAPEHHVAHGKASSIPWIAEYAAGLQHLLFPVCLPPFFDGLRYRDAAEKLYQHSHVILLGLYDDSAASHGRRRIRLCPFGESLRGHDIGFLIAPSASAAKLAVDSLELRLQTQAPRPRRRWSGRAAKPGGGPAPLSTLVFSSDTVLSRQSFADARSHSIRVDEEDPVRVEDDAGEDESRTSDADESVHSVSFLPLFAPVASAGTASAPAARRMLRVHSDSWVGTSSASASASMSPDPAKLRRQQTVPALRRSASSLDGGGRRRLRNHVVVCGPAAQCQQLAWYLDTLFAHEAPGARPTVVLLVEAAPSEEQLPADCFLEYGASTSVEDLLRVRAFDARAVLFVPGGSALDADDALDDADDHLLDYQVIMSTLSLQTIQELRRDQLHQQQQPPDGALVPVAASSVVRARDSIKYFAYKISKDDHEHHEEAARRLAARRGPPLFDAFHGQHERHEHEPQPPTDHHAWSFLGRHRHEASALEAELLLPAEFAPAYAAGEVLVDSFLDTLLCQSFFNPYVVDLVRALAGDYYYYYQPQPQFGDGDGDAATLGDAAPPSLDTGDFPHAVLSTASVARALVGESFQRVFERALAQKVLVLAVYRRAESDAELLGGRGGGGGRGNARPYVFTCPDGRADHALARGDALHVLSRRRPPICID